MSQTHTIEHIQQAVRDYILSSFLSGSAADDFRDGDDLLTILDSLQILRMLLDLEARYSIHVANSELSPDNLGTVERLAAFVARKRRESTC